MTTITIERAVVHRALSALEYHTQQTRPIHNTELVIEELRDALAAPATSPEKCGHCGRRTIDPPWPVRTAPTTDDRHALQAAGTHPAPCARYCEAKAFELEIRGRKADTVRAEQALLAQDITLQNMAERHAQELCAYSVTVDKLRAERKPMTPKQIYQICPELCNDEAIVEFARRIELHHGIGDKP